MLSTNTHLPKKMNMDKNRAASRGGVNMNMYEKMFFDKGGKDMQLLGGKSLKADSALIPVDHNDTITNYFNKVPYKKQDETFRTNKGGIPIFERSPEALKKTHGYDMNSNSPYETNIEIPTINTNIKNQVKKEKYHFDYGVDDDKTSIKADDTLDFINKINNVGNKDYSGSNDKKFGRQNSLQKKANELKSNRLNESGYTVNTNNLAEKLDIDNFPALPDYEGIQSEFLKKSRKEPEVRNFEMNRAEPLNTSILSDNTVPFKFTDMGRVRDSTSSLADGTVNTMKTVNTINLERINNKNENRLRDIEERYNFRDGKH